MRFLLLLVVGSGWLLNCSNDRANTLPSPPAATVESPSILALDTAMQEPKEVLVATNKAVPKAATKTATTNPKNEKKTPTIAISTPKVSSSVPLSTAKSNGINVVVTQDASATAKPLTNKKTSIATETPIAPSSKAANTVEHTAFDALLQQYVDAKGRVNYTALKKAESQLDAYLTTLAAAAPTSTWARNEALAYWINAYNAATLKLILKNWPLKSITDLHGGKPWDVQWILLGGKTYSLNQIEHDIIRPTFQDARIHFAVNCAAKSCPPLHNRAFTAAKVNVTLQQLSRSFINNSQYNEIAGGEAQLSKLFEWYASDFGKLRAYLNQYLATPLQEDASISYKEYDWALNGF